VNLKFENVTKSEDIYKVYVEKSKTDISGKGFTFFISGDDKIHIDNYFSCFKVLKGRLFCKIKNGNGTACVLGKNVIAKFLLQLPKTLVCLIPKLLQGTVLEDREPPLWQIQVLRKLHLKEPVDGNLIQCVMAILPSHPL
jgi:hypothetical protein